MTNYSRRDFLRRAAAAAMAAPFITCNLIAAPPSQTIYHASIGASRQAGRDLDNLGRMSGVKLVALADVDSAKSAPWKEKYPAARIYSDWRELLAKEKHLDSLNVSTPDHMHAAIAMSAMRLGKHVYVQKPLAHDIYEVRQLTRYAHGKKLVTQMGIQIQSGSEYRQAVQLVRDGTIGKVKEVYSWCAKSWGNANPQPDRQDAPPAGFNWDLWTGTAAARPFIGDGYYHPQAWRSKLDFGTGSFGDMGCHIFDPVFGSLDLTAPISVRSEGPAPNAGHWAPNSIVHYVFPGTAFTAEKTFNLSWYDGVERPPKEILALAPTEYFPNVGSIFIGTKGVMLLPHIARPRLYPAKDFADFQLPKVEDGNHYRQFAQAIREQGTTGARFDYAGPLTEAVLLGGVASRFPKTTLLWDSRAMTFKNEKSANAFLRRGYRAGWHVRGLS
ncbi:MAG: Gfo/Idh/MocA family oxidoreductase [Pedosphaera sp.]|nr:Gfo/Idh/MocA family oxidoreductase [Pedosphaera sp.]